MGVKDSVELRFRLTREPHELEALTAALTPYGDGPYPEHPIEIPSLAVQTWAAADGAVVGQVAPGASPPPSGVTSVTVQTWLMDYHGRVIAFDVTSYPGTTPAYIAEAEAAIRSVRPERPDPAATPVPSGHPYPIPRFIFELTQGWDSG